MGSSPGSASDPASCKCMPGEAAGDGPRRSCAWSSWLQLGTALDADMGIWEVKQWMRDHSLSLSFKSGLFEIKHIPNDSCRLSFCGDAKIALVCRHLWLHHIQIKIKKRYVSSGVLTIS